MICPITEIPIPLRFIFVRRSPPQMLFTESSSLYMYMLPLISYCLVDAPAQPPPGGRRHSSFSLLKIFIFLYIYDVCYIFFLLVKFRSRSFVVGLNLYYDISTI